MTADNNMITGMITPNDTPQPVHHPVLGRLNYSTTTIREDPDGQVEDTIALMRAYVIEDVGSEEIGEAVREALGERRPGDGEVEAVWRWIRARVKFVLDRDTAAPFGSSDVVEVLIRPRDMVTLGGVARGDCDDFVMLGAAMLMRLGLGVRFVTVAADRRDTGRYSHVYLRVRTGDGQWVAFDSSHGKQVGWEAPRERVYRIREWAVRDNPLAAVLVIGALYYVVQRYA